MLSIGGNGAIATNGAGPRFAAWSPYGSRAWWWALGIGGAMLAAAYAPNLRALAHTWSIDENYTHGYLVIPIALFILWRRLKDIPWQDSANVAAAPWWGWGLLAASLVARSLAYEWGYHWAETATILPAIVGLTWSFGGASLLYRIWPAVLFLAFMLPLPNSVNNLIALPLQRLAATGSYYCLQVLGFWVVQAGNVLHLTTPFGTRSLDVAAACSGLKMLMTLAATVTATILLLPLPTWKRLVLLVSAVPIALFSNLIRILVTGLCYYYIQGDGGRRWAHDISGWMMMPLALILVGSELQLLAWLTPERTEAEEADRQVILPALERKAKGRKAAPLDRAELERRRRNLRPLLGGKGKDDTTPMLDE